MNKELYIPKFRYLTQNLDGIVRTHINFPQQDYEISEYISDYMIVVSEGTRNTDWVNTLIDLDAVNAGCAGYTFEGGILKPVDCDGGNDAAKDRYKL